MGTVYTQLSMQERRAIEDMLNAKIAVREIAAEIGRHVSTVYREIKRNFLADDTPKLLLHAEKSASSVGPCSLRRQTLHHTTSNGFAITPTSCIRKSPVSGSSASA